MGRLCETDGLTEDQNEILKAVRTFVDEKILPVATELEHKDEYPTEIVEGMKELGRLRADDPRGVRRAGRVAADLRPGGRGDRPRLDERVRHHQHPLHRGLHAAPARHRGAEAEVPARGWRRARCAVRSRCPSPAAAPTSRRSRPRPSRTTTAYSITGQKMWLTNGGSSNLVAVLVKTDEGADSVYKNMTTFLVEKEAGFGETAPGVTIPGKIEKMGYKGVDTTEMVFEGHQISADQILGGEPGKGFYQMMDGVEVGRVNVAARGVRGGQPGLRARRLLRPAARDLRQEDRRAPGRAVPPGRDGDQGRGRPPDDGRGRADEGQGSAQRPRGRHGQVPRQRVLLAGRRGLLPDPRRLRLLQGVRDRAALPRGADAADRRGHGRHPADDHRPPAARGLQAE